MLRRRVVQAIVVFYEGLGDGQVMPVLGGERLAGNDCVIRKGSGKAVID